MVIVYEKKSILEGVNFFSFFSLGETQQHFDSMVFRVFVIMLMMMKMKMSNWAQVWQ